MASGLPVVASDWSGYRELVQDGETGFLIPTLMGNQLSAVLPLNTIEADVASHWLLGQATCIDVVILAKRLRYLANFPEVRKQMGSVGRRKALAYDWSRIIPRYEELWAELGSVPLADQILRPKRSSVVDYERRHAFACFATNSVSSEGQISISELGRRAIRGELRVLLEAQADPFVTAISRGILETLEERGATTLSDLEKSLPVESKKVVSAHAIRLVKYGLAEIQQVSGCIPPG